METGNGDCSDTGTVTEGEGKRKQESRTNTQAQSHAQHNILSNSFSLASCVRNVNVLY